MRCITFERFLPTGATRPFLARDDQRCLWVVKAHGNPLGTKAILNEYVTGSLAGAIGLPWPEVSIVRLTPDVLASLRQEGFEVQSEWAIGLRYITGLREVSWPPGGYQRGKGFRERNAQHILGLFPNLAMHAAFYGKALFDNWLLLGDTKYDTLHIDPKGCPLFLDASLALAGTEWDAKLLEWVWARIDVWSPYLEGVITDRSQFEPWLGRIAGIDRSFIDSVLADIPEAWSVPADYVVATGEFLAATEQQFVPLFRDWLDWQMQMLDMYGCG